MKRRWDDEGGVGFYIRSSRSALRIQSICDGGLAVLDSKKNGRQCELLSKGLHATGIGSPWESIS